MKKNLCFALLSLNTIVLAQGDPRLGRRNFLQSICAGALLPFPTSKAERAVPAWQARSLSPHLDNIQFGLESYSQSLTALLSELAPSLRREHEKEIRRFRDEVWARIQSSQNSSTRHPYFFRISDTQALQVRPTFMVNGFPVTSLSLADTDPKTGAPAILYALIPSQD